MKIASLILFLVVGYGAPVLGGEKKPADSHVSVLSVKREVFYFKVSKEFIGATAEIFNQRGEMIHSEKVVKRKTILDFFDHEAGTYTIKITKGELVEEFECTFNLR